MLARDDIRASRCQKPKLTNKLCLTPVQVVKPRVDCINQTTCRASSTRLFQDLDEYDVMSAADSWWRSSIAPIRRFLELHDRAVSYLTLKPDLFFFSLF